MSDLPSILIVDDHDANLVVFRQVLEKTNAQLVTVDSGIEALKLATYQAFAMILLDVQMPDMDGFEVARLLRATNRHKDTPIIFISAAYTELADCLLGYTLGAVDYIRKPVDNLILLSKVMVFLELFESRRQQAVLLAELQASNKQMAEEIRIRKKLEADQVESLQRLAQAQEIAQMGNWEWNFATEMVVCSEQIGRILGWDFPAERVTTQQFTAAIQADDQPVFMQMIHDAKTVVGEFQGDTELRVVRQMASGASCMCECELIRTRMTAPFVWSVRCAM